MANYFEQFDTAGPSESGPPPQEDNYFAQFDAPAPVAREKNYFAQFDVQPQQLPATEQEFRTQSGRAPATDEELIKYYHKGPEETFKPFGESQLRSQPESQLNEAQWDQLEERRGEEFRRTAPQAEGELATGAREAAHGVVPTLAGIATGARLGAPAGAAIGTAILPGIGTTAGAIIGGLGGGIIGGGAAYLAQESGAKLLGFDDAQQRAVNEKLNPKSALAGQLAPMALGFGPGAVGRTVAERLASRGLGAAIGGGLEAGQELVQGELDPTRIAAGAATGAVFAKPRGWVTAAEGQPHPHGSPGPDAAAGTAKEQPPPPQVFEEQPGNAARYSKKTAPQEPPGPRVTTIEPDPAIAAAVRGEPIQPRVTEAEAPPVAPEPRVTEEPAPGYWGTKLEQEFPRARVTEGEASTAARTPREAIAQRQPEETVGGALQRFIQDERGGGRIPPRQPVEPEEAMPTPRVIAGEAAPARDLNAALAGRGFTPEQIRALTPEQTQAILQKRQGEVGAGPPAAEAPAPTPAQPAQPAAPPPAAPPTPPGPPPNVGQAAAAAGGTPPPPAKGPTSMAYAPPQQRSNLSNLWRSTKLLVGADIGPHGKAAENIIRGSYGDANRTFEQMVDLVAPHQATIQAMDPLERRAMINRMEGENRWPGYQPTSEQQQLIKDNKTAMDLWKDRLSGLDRTQQMDFVENYLAHMYENPQQAQKFFGDFMRRGGAGSTKKRTLPTYEDAIEAGLKPFSDNPIEIATRYGLSMKNFVAANDALQRGVETGVVGYFKPGKTIGASGSPEPLQVGGPPPGWKKLDAPPKNKYGLEAYAPEDFADKYNTFYDQGVGQRAKPLYEALRNTNSAWTQLELGLNSYHFFTMANEAIISDVAKGLAQVMSGQFKEGATSIIKSPLAPRTRYVEGKRFQQEYLDPNSTNPIASIMAEANARPIGRGHAADILGGQAHPTDVTPAVRGSFIKNFSRDKINFELEKAWTEVKQDWGLADTVSKQALFPFKQASRALQTVGAPLFDKYIPTLKAGAVHSQMDAWIKANPNVDITTPDGRRLAVDAAQKIVDSTDNRFGEMIHDNLFMNQTLRQAAMTSMRSFSWTVGAMRELAGGVGAAGKAAVGSIKDRENRFSMAHPEFDPRISYALAFPFVVATTSAMYQFLKTGEAPQDPYDLYAPRTGGTVPGLGGKGQVPEHVLMPGFQKDVYGWLAHPLREGYAKLGGVPTTAYEQITNENWRGDPIYRRGADPMEHLQQRTAHVLSRLGPIGVKNFVKGQPETSEIPAWQTALGFRAPGADIQDPVALENWMRAKSAREWEAKTRHEKTEAKKYSRERVAGLRQYERVSPE